MTENSQTLKFSRSVSLILMFTSYALAMFAAVVTAKYFPSDHPIIIAGMADLAATLVIFIFSFSFKNSSFYDPYWSVAVPILAFYFIYTASPEADNLRQALVFALALFWAVRLTYNFLRGWDDISHEDWRYKNLKESSGKFYWVVSFSGIHLFPTILVFLGCLSIYAAAGAGTNPIGWLDAVAFIVTFGAIMIELISDEQLYAFRMNSERDQQDFIKTGLWAYSRHPNYFGEVMFWWGLYLFALAAGFSFWWAIAGPLAMTLLFVFISIPMMDEKMVLKRPAYAEHMRKVPAIFPWKIKG